MAEDFWYDRTVNPYSGDLAEYGFGPEHRWFTRDPSPTPAPPPSSSPAGGSGPSPLTQLGAVARQNAEGPTDHQFNPQTGDPSQSLTDLADNLAMSLAGEPMMGLNPYALDNRYNTYYGPLAEKAGMLSMVPGVGTVAGGLGLLGDVANANRGLESLGLPGTVEWGPAMGDMVTLGLMGASPREQKAQAVLESGLTRMARNPHALHAQPSPRLPAHVRARVEPTPHGWAERSNRAPAYMAARTEPTPHAWADSPAASPSVAPSAEPAFGQALGLDRSAEQIARDVSFDPGHHSSESTIGGAGGTGPGSTDSSCFITTAAVSHMGLPDDGHHLTTLREFRDNKLGPQSALVREYYQIAPGIVQRLSARSDAPKVYKNLFNEYIEPTVKLIEMGQDTQAIELYRQMVLHAETLAGTPNG